MTEKEAKDGLTLKEATVKHDANWWSVWELNSVWEIDTTVTV